MLRFAICDDEQWMAQELSTGISGYLSGKGIVSYSVSIFSSGRKLLESGEAFDMIFLDIQMAPPDGMETARLLRRGRNPALLVFVTVLREQVFEAFEVEAYDYLVKPLDEKRFGRMMDRAIKTLSERKACLVIRQGGSCEVVPLSEIVYCEVQGRKLYLHQTGGKVTGHYERLEDLKQRVDGRFFHCHRSYLVNLEYVRGCEDGQVVLPQNERIPLSRLRERGFREALLCYLKERSC